MEMGGFRGILDPRMNALHDERSAVARHHAGFQRCDILHLASQKKRRSACGRVGNAARGESVISLPVHVGAQHGPRMVPQKVSVIAGHPADNDMSFMKCEKCGRKEMFPLARVVAWGDALWECQLAGLRCFSVRQRRAPQ